MVKRPLPLRIFPSRVKEWLYYRFYHEEHAAWSELFEVASLALAPKVAMYDLIPGDVISGNIAFNGFYEPDLSRRIVKAAGSGQRTFVDVGANMGYFSLLWASHNPYGRIFCFEAAPRNIKLIEKNINRNQFSDLVTVIGKAAGHFSGVTHFAVGPHHQTGWGGIEIASSHETISVPIVRLDEALSGKAIDVLKIDVEGADTWVLRGAERLLKAGLIKNVYFEQNPGRMSPLGIQLGEAQAFLERCGYASVAIDKAKAQWWAYPKSRRSTKKAGSEEPA